MVLVSQLRVSAAPQASPGPLLAAIDEAQPRLLAARPRPRQARSNTWSNTKWRSVLLRGCSYALALSGSRRYIMALMRDELRIIQH